MRRLRLWRAIVFLTGVLVSSFAGAQPPSPSQEPDTVWLTGAPSPSPFSPLFQPQAPFRMSPSLALPADVAGVAGVAGAEAVRDCDACPRRRPWSAVVQTLGVNVAFNLVNRLRTPNDEFKVSLASWWENLRYGFEWDFNSFTVNQFGHPYQGSLYFNAGRANGLNFWESAPLAALGSATWEYFGEKNHASINDFVTTTMGGIALGEMFHRAGWMIRDTTQTGGARKKGEILAMLADPITGLNRFMNGDASRVSEHPPGLKPTIRVGDFEVGSQWNGEPNQRAINSVGEAFVGLRLGYNDIFSSPYKLPFDAFNVTLRLGGGAGISEATVRGRLYGRFIGADRQEHHTEFVVVQAYDYETNGIFDYGGQSIVAGLSRVFVLSRSTQLAAFGLAGPIVMGAITSPLLSETPTEHAAEEGSQRTYDFGPGAEIAGGAMLRVRRLPVARFTYGGFYLRSVSSVEGVTGQHYAQFLRLDLLAPLWRQLRLGVSADYINRATYYRDLPDAHQWLPQFRVYIAKVSR
jgi:hypothetical protein